MLPARAEPHGTEEHEPPEHRWSLKARRWRLLREADRHSSGEDGDYLLNGRYVRVTYQEAEGQVKRQQHTIQMIKDKEASKLFQQKLHRGCDHWY